ncbi:SemiSWEET transporter [Immundisolibacter sp.]|uniref:SemiSWEET transporter n=1 Tax=Immundisolibacter sp. TaxID=1934948 RepID=UPI00261248EB|nr:SemiSWEET transporter [Immundisolibacter sp.]MDD3649974.1 SemiSWEET transporter [Immundisolibacter sp.]
MITAVGLLAALLTTVAFLPQVLHTLATRDTRGISLRMYVIFVAGVLLWLVYGLLTRDLPLILANAVTLALAGTILYLKLRHG